MKNELSGLVALFGALVSYAFGGFSTALQILLYLMALDYLSGIASAYHNKELSSKVGFKGACKKIMILIICSLAYKIDLLFHANSLIASGAIIYYCCNEALSIIENAIELDLPVPAKLKNAINSMLSDQEE